VNAFLQTDENPPPEPTEDIYDMSPVTEVRMKGWQLDAAR
jgi:hypothetical protein